MPEAQKGIGGFFQTDGERYGGLIGSTPFARLPDTLQDVRVVGFAGEGERQVERGVFMRAIHQGVIGKHRQTLQRVMELFRCAFKIAPAAGTEHDVAAKHGVRRDIGKVIADMSRHFPDAEFDGGCGQQQLIVLAQGMRDVRILRMAASVHRHVIYFAQFGDAADVVVMTVGAQDGAEAQSGAAQEIEHRGGFARIDDGDMGVIMDRPDVVVLQGGDGGDVQHDGVSGFDA